MRLINKEPTAREQKAARLKGRDAIPLMYYFLVGMELIGAFDGDQWEVIKREVDALLY